MPKRTRNAGPGKTLLKEQLSREMRQKKLDLFLQHFDKEVQDRVNYYTMNRETLLATVDRAYETELMKFPPSIRNACIMDFIKDKATPASDVSMVIENESPKQQPPLRRMQRRVKLGDSSPVQSSPPQSSSTKTSRGGKGTKRTRALVASNSTGNLCSPVTSKRTQSCLKTTDQDVTVKPKLRSVVSAGDIRCSMAACSAHITVTTAQGQTLSFSEETKDEIDFGLLDDVAWCQIQKLTRLINHLSK